MDTTAPDNYIAWTAAPATNTLRLKHVGCVVGDGTWTLPLDDIHLPLTGDRTHCECCGLEKRLCRGNGSAEAFRLDRGRLRVHLVAEGETEPDDDARPAGVRDTGPQAIAGFFLHAIDAGAVRGVDDVEVNVYECGDDAVVITVREKDPPLDIPWTALRQLASLGIETEDLASEYSPQSFDEACGLVTEILCVASGLVPSLRALQLLEATLRDDRARPAQRPAPVGPGGWRTSSSRPAARACAGTRERHRSSGRRRCANGGCRAAASSCAPTARSARKTTSAAPAAQPPVFSASKAGWSCTPPTTTRRRS